MTAAASAAAAAALANRERHSLIVLKPPILMDSCSRERVKHRTTGLARGVFIVSFLVFLLLFVFFVVGFAVWTICVFCYGVCSMDGGEEAAAVAAAAGGAELWHSTFFVFAACSVRHT